METVFIDPGSAIPLADLQALLARHWPVEQTRSGALVIQEGGTRLYAYHDPPEGPERLGRLGLDYSSLALLRKVLALVADRPDVAVDNDFGTVLPGDRFVALLRERPDWDWRREPSRSPRPERPGS